MKDLTPPGQNSTNSDNSVVSFPGQRSPNDRQHYDYPAVEATYVEEDEINLRDLWQVLVNRRWVVMIFFLIVVSATIISTYLATPIYRSSLTLQINRDAPKVLNYQDVTPSESAYEKDFYQTQYELLKSRSLAKRVISQLDLKNNRLFTGYIDEDEADTSPGSKTSTVQDRKKDKLMENNLVDKFLANLTIEPVKRSRLVKVHFESSDPDLAAKITNTIAKDFINMNLERRFNASSYAKTFIEDRLRQVKANLEDSERQLIKFARDNEIINFDDKQPIIMNQFQQANNALVKTEEERLEAEALYEQMLDTKDQGLKEILNNSVIQELKQTKAKLEGEYQEKLAIYKPAYPTMVQFRSRINEIQQSIDREVDNIRSAIYATYSAQKREETLLIAKMSNLKEQVLALQDRSIQYKILQRETNTNKQLYQGLLQRMKEVGVAGGISTNNITIIDKAETPGNKHKPNLSLNTLLATIFGLIGGVFLAFFFEYFDDTIKAPDDLEKHTQLPVLGLVPELRTLPGGENTDETEVGLLSHYDPRSEIAEAYRSTRTALQFSTASGSPDVLLVTSASPGEGKTTSAMNIAITFSQLGNKVLIIDTDLRNPSIHTVLGIDNTKGLTNYLAGDARPVDISVHTRVVNLFAIPSGPLPPNPAELLTDNKMHELIDQSKTRFDFVVLDGPPVMGLADALVLASIADGTIIVAESGTTRHEHLQAALKRLQTTNVTIVGAVLSKYSPQNGAYNDYHSYYYYHREESPNPATMLKNDPVIARKRTPT